MEEKKRVIPKIATILGKYVHKQLINQLIYIYLIFREESSPRIILILYSPLLDLWHTSLFSIKINVKNRANFFKFANFYKFTCL